MKISIVIPAHNEEQRIGKTLDEYANFFRKKYKNKFEIIVVLNGCIDNTLGVIKKVKKRYNQINYLDFKQSGKGFAIIEGFKVSKGDLIGFTDADASTNARAFNDLIKNINGYECIIASRWIKGAVVKSKQPFSRILAGRAFNFLVRSLFGLKVHDTQCGAKLFRKEIIKKILPKIGITEWAFDVDFLYHLKKEGFKIKEIPTVWHDKPHSKLNLAKTTIEMFSAIIRLRLDYSCLKFIVRVYDLLPEIIKIHHKQKNNSKQNQTEDRRLL